MPFTVDNLAAHEARGQGGAITAANLGGDERALVDAGQVRRRFRAGFPLQAGQVRAAQLRQQRIGSRRQPRPPQRAKTREQGRGEGEERFGGKRRRGGPGRDAGGLQQTRAQRRELGRGRPLRQQGKRPEGRDDVHRQTLPQQREAAHELGAHGALRAPQSRGDLRRHQALAEMQVEHLAVGRADRTAHLGQHRHELGTGGLVRRVGDGAGAFEDPGALKDHGPAFLVATALLLQLARVVAENADQPRYRRSAQIEVRARFDDREEGALQKVLSVGAVAAEPQGGAQQFGSGPVEELAERARVPGPTEVAEQAVGAAERADHCGVFPVQAWLATRFRAV